MRLKVTKAVIRRLRYLMNNSSTRSRAYRIFAEEYHCTVGAARKVASRYGLTKKRSLHYSFTAGEEEDIAKVCNKYALRGAPLLVPDVIELASKYKSRPKENRFSRHFVSLFLSRNKSSLCIKSGKDTSPARSSDIMEQHTNKFINELNPLFERKIINKNNLCVFDETVINEPAARYSAWERVDNLVVKTSIFIRHMGKDWAASSHFQ